MRVRSCELKTLTLDSQLSTLNSRLSTLMKNKAWSFRPWNINWASQLEKTLGVTPLTARLLACRDLAGLPEAQAYLNPHPSQLHDPMLMKDMDRTVERILYALKHKEPMVIYADYDADGTTAAAILLMVLKDLGAEPSFYIPHRVREGYGLNEEAVKKIAAGGAKLLITVDCGITSTQEVALAHRLGMEVIVTDHHLPQGQLPAAYAILNPLQEGCPYPFKSLAGVGVAWKLAQALRKTLRRQKDRELPEGEDYLDLLALGTIADIVPLVGENRVIAKLGLKRLSEGKRPGIAALKEVAGISNQEVTAGQVSFLLGPRLNASGRLSHADTGVRLLCAQSREEALPLASLLNTENRERQKIETEILEEAKLLALADGVGEEDFVLVLAKEGWHVGVIGIVASRLQEEYYRPVVMIGLEGELGKGSARSIPGFHLHQALTQCQDLLVTFGGHQYAAGLKVKRENIEDLKARMNQIARETLTPQDLIPQLKVEAKVTLEEITPTIIKELALMAPFGYGNPEPTLMAEGLEVEGYPMVVGKNHLKFRVKHGSAVVEAIAFGQAEEAQDLIDNSHKIRLAFYPQLSVWGTRSKVTLKIKALEEDFLARKAKKN